MKTPPVCPGDRGGLVMCGSRGTVSLIPRNGSRLLLTSARSCEGGLGGMRWERTARGGLYLGRCHVGNEFGVGHGWLARGVTGYLLVASMELEAQPRLCHVLQFLGPVVYHISRGISQERENCVNK